MNTDSLSSVHITSFVQERLEDVQYLTEAINSINGQSKCFGIAPKRHLRRRATSYLKRIIPRRNKLSLKNHNLQKKLKDFHKRCRKHRRRPILLHANRSLHNENCSGKSFWLETHIWHAKRMKMKELWGFSLPLHHNGRGIRAMGKALKQKSIIHDLSYYRPIEISGNLCSVLEILKEHTDPCASCFTSTDVLVGAREVDILVHRRLAFPRDCLGPAMLCFRPDKSWSGRSIDVQNFDENNQDFITVWLWSHPASFYTVLDSLRQSAESHRSADGTVATVGLLSGGLVRMQIRGNSSLDLIREVFLNDLPSPVMTARHPSSNAVSANAELEVANAVSLGRLLADNTGAGATTWAQSAVVGVRVGDVRSLRFRSAVSGKGHSSTSPSEYHTLDANETETDTAMFWEGQSQYSSLWDVCSRADASSHVSKAVTIEGSQLLVSSSTLIGQCTVPLIFIRKEMSSHECYTYTASSKVAAPWHRPAHPLYTSGVDIIAPASWGSALWHALVFAGGRAVGLKEMECLSLETGIRAFPRDFPDSKAGRVFWRERATECGRRSKRRRWREARVHVNWKDLLVERSAGATEHSVVVMDEPSKSDVQGVQEDEPTVMPTDKGKKAVWRKQWGATGFVVVGGGGEGYTTAFAVPVWREGGWTCPPPLPVLPRPTLLAVRLWVPGRGVPEVGAELLAPTHGESLVTDEDGSSLQIGDTCDGGGDGDIAAWINGILRLEESGLTGRNRLLGAGLGMWRGRQYCSPTAAKESGRLLVGFVTSGGMSVLFGTAVAIGLCHADRLHDMQRQLYLLQTNHEPSISNLDLKLSSLVVFRNPSSCWCRPALLEIIPC